MIQSNREPRPGMDKNHLAMVRNLPCCVCGMIGKTNAHHLLRTGEHGVGRKSSDRFAIPLCSRLSGGGGHHEALHAAGDEEAFLMLHGVDGRALASALWAKRGNQDAMSSAAFKFRQKAALKMKERAA